MRCFIACCLDPNSIKAIEEFQRELKKQDSRWRFTPSQKLHLTFLFLGNNVSENDIKSIEEKLQKISLEFKAFEAFAKGFGAFPKPHFASVLWCSLNSDNLYLLASRIRRELSLLSFKDDKEFSPHVTIARSNKKLDATTLIKKYKDIVWSKQNCIIDNICLFQSIPNKEGYIYKIIKKFVMV
ncbi:MAG: RNA 2',3'-cyclic phosphodiesterase [Candidatus Anstonellaceae archaeon]